MNTKAIAKARKASRITQQELADMLGVHRVTVARWETNVAEPDLSMIPDIAEALHLSIPKLMAIIFPETSLAKP